VNIDWTSAQVRRGKLTVTLAETPSSAWRKRFRAVQARLQRAGEPWDEIALKQAQITVSGVLEGSEADVRHFLESVVLEANASDPDAGAGQAAEGDDTQAPTVDTRMTASFQAFDTGDTSAE
jgi:hypothetical protein